MIVHPHAATPGALKELPCATEHGTYVYLPPVSVWMVGLLGM